MSRFTARQAPMGPPPDPAYCAESNVSEILGVTGSMMTIAIIICGLRLMVRTFMIRSVGADDYVMLWALLMAIGTFTCFVGESDHGNGRHVACITPEDYSMYARWQYAHSLLVMWGVILVKISIALFLMRLVPQTTRKWKNFLWASIAFLICFMLACTGTLVFQCWPVRAAWDFAARQTANCFSNNTFSAIGLTNSSINAATDLLFAILPIPVIWKLQVNKRTKVTLAMILSLGYFACAAGIIKAVKQGNFFDEQDPLWHNSFNVWNMIELCIGIVAASLPALRPLFVRILASTKSFTRSRQSSKDRSLVSGYRRHNDKGPYAVPPDVPLSDMKNTFSSNTDSTMKTHQSQVTRDEDAFIQSDPKRYTVGVTAATDPGDDGSWEGIEPVRAASSERLHRPQDSHIFKTTETTQISYHIDELPGHSRRF